MKKIISIAYYEFLRNIRDYKMSIMIVLAPILLIFLLGSSLDSMLSLEYMEAPVVGFVNLDEGQMGEGLDDYLHHDEVKKVITVINYNDQISAEEAIKNKEISCFILINSNYSETLLLGNETEISIYGKENNTYTETVLNAYVNQLNVSLAISNKQLPLYEQTPVKLERGVINKDSSYPVSMDYYSVQTLLQVLIISSVLGISIILKDFKDGMYIRLNSMPVRRGELVSGRMLGSIFYGFFAGVVTILFSKYAYGANWSGNIFVILSTMFLFVMISIGMGVLLAHLTKNYTTALGIVALSSLIFAASAGAFSPKTSVKQLAVISPNYYAKNILFGTIYDYPTSVIVSGYLGLLAIIAFIFTLIILFERKRTYENF